MRVKLRVLTALVFECSHCHTSNKRCPIGSNLKNHYLLPHWQSGTRVGIKFRVHQGDIQVDVLSGETTASEWGTLETKAGISQGAFNSEADSIWGDDYTDLATADKGALRNLFEIGLP